MILELDFGCLKMHCPGLKNATEFRWFSPISNLQKRGPGSINSEMVRFADNRIFIIGFESRHNKIRCEMITYR